LVRDNNLFYLNIFKFVRKGIKGKKKIIIEKILKKNKKLKLIIMKKELKIKKLKS
jgi:hypothetical protein